ncbi:MAG: tRNA (adenosine(37)-N6)-threonylcarbamoyltransferase complex transferase subunit TsaD [Chloroflexota bacterium]
MLVLGIESSCDETAAAVVEDGRRTLSDVVASQAALHARTGGVVPEVASRQHLAHITPVIQGALAEAGVGLDDLDAIAVTHGPGLMGCLMVGVNAAKALAYARGLPLVGVHHLEAHAHAAWLGPVNPAQGAGFPLVVLIASGAHTDLILMREHGDYQVLGRTRDDAAGEAFDKAARILGLAYPGGPAIERAADGALAAAPLPRAWLDGSLDFSFSGLKTALLHRAQEAGLYPERPARPDPALVNGLAAAFQEAVAHVISVKAAEAVRRVGARGLVLGGGVAANTLLRQRCLERSPVPVIIPAPRLCTDNGAMVGAAGYYRYQRGIRHYAGLDAVPDLILS